MASSISRINVFVASPGDVFDERERLAPALARLNRTHGLRDGFVLELVRWETHARPGMGVDAQDVINQQMAPVDIFIGIMWQRFGTPTKRAESGTAEEFERAYTEWSNHGTPSILLYFSEAPAEAAALANQDQREKVVAFRQMVEARGALTWSYGSPEQFVQLAEEHLTHEVYRVLQRYRAKSDSRPVSSRRSKAALDWGSQQVSDAAGMVSTIRNLIRLADDLAMASDKYLVRPPTTRSTFGEQNQTLNGAIDRYNSAIDRLTRSLPDFEAFVDSLNLATLDALRECALTTLARARDFPSGYEQLELEEAEDFQRRYRQLSLEWSEARTLLEPKLKRGRKQLAKFEVMLEAQVSVGDAAVQARDCADAVWEAHGLLADYVAQAQGCAKAIEDFLDGGLHDVEATIAGAWGIAPWITSMNETFFAIEERGFFIRLQLLGAGGNTRAHRRIAQAIQDANDYQWDEVRPLLGSLSGINVVLVQGHANSNEILAHLRKRRREWQNTVEVLKLSARRFDIRQELDELIGKS